MSTTVRDENGAARDQIGDLLKRTLWVGQRKMKFNAGKTEKASFSCKRKETSHLALNFGEIISSKSEKSEHEHFGLIQVSKLKFKSYRGEAIFKSQKGIALLKYLSNDTSRGVFDQIWRYILLCNGHCARVR